MNLNLCSRSSCSLSPLFPGLPKVSYPWNGYCENMPPVLCNLSLYSWSFNVSLSFLNKSEFLIHIDQIIVHVSPKIFARTDISLTQAQMFQNRHESFLGSYIFLVKKIITLYCFLRAMCFLMMQQNCQYCTFLITIIYRFKCMLLNFKSLIQIVVPYLWGQAPCQN